MTTPHHSAGHSFSTVAISTTGKRAAILVAAAIAAQYGSLAHAQSTASAAVEDKLTEVVVTGSRIPTTLGSVMEQNATKTRVTFDQDYLAKQVAGQSIVQSINQSPGVNFTNNDAFGNSGGNLRIRGFDGSRVSGTFDGMPINDSGNYAFFTNQLLDPELIERVDVNLGTTDVDSPTASATGGTVAFRSITPPREMGAHVIASVGDEDYRRLFGRFDTGEFGPWGTRAWVAASASDYDKFKGPGDLEKRQFNAKFLQDIGEVGDFVSIAFHWNRNRNAFYRNASAATFAQFGRDYDNLPTCTRDTPTAGTRDNEGATPVTANTPVLSGDNLLNPSSCSNYFGLRINPSDTGNVRAQSLFHFGEKLRLTIDPSFQYTLANGGGTTVLDETPAANQPDRRLIGTATGVTGVDLNGDGDLLDSVRFYTPNITNTRRYGLTSSLIYDINDENLVRLAYTLDYAQHRQTSAYGGIDAAGNPLDVFAGLRSPKVRTADGNYIRGRDRYSVAELNQIAAEYRGEFIDNKLIMQVGLRAPFFKRDLNQFCYTPNGGNGNSGNVTTTSLCTTQTPVQPLPNGNVLFATTGTITEYIPPYQDTIKFDEVLPNIGATFRLTDEHTIYGSFAENLSAPRTDNLYPVRRLADGSIGRGIPESEKTQAFDLGWRFNASNVLASVALYRVDYDNRLVSSFDQDLGFTVDRNVGKVDVQGVDAQAGFRPIPLLTLSGSASWNDSKLKENVPTSATAFLATKGKKLVETPEWQYSLRADFDFTDDFRAGIQGKYVDKRPSTDLNNEFTPSYTVVDLDASYKFELNGFVKTLEAQLNVVNLLDEEYFGSISSGTGVGTNLGQFALGAPRTFILSLKADF
jgi:iron complex outermembrane receptor protein